MLGQTVFASALVLLAAGHSASIASSTPIEEVPFVTTPDHVTLAMLKLADVTAQDHVIDLGSGDGRIVITAARHFGASGLGLEIVPGLVAQSGVNAQKAGVADRARFRVQNLLEADLSAATVVTMYLLPEVNLQLRPRLLALAPGTRIVSHDWDMGDWEPDRTVTLPVPDKSVGLEKLSRVHLWRVPAQVQGRWCSGSFTLDITQRYQTYRANLVSGGQNYPWAGHIMGSALTASPMTNAPPPSLILKDGMMHVTTGTSVVPVGTSFVAC